MPRCDRSQSIMGSDGKLGTCVAARQPERVDYLAMPPLSRALLLVLVAGACHRPAAEPLNPRAEVAVTVGNQNFLAMDGFLVRGGQPIPPAMGRGLCSRLA